jgi:hypothetical protein
MEARWARTARGWSVALLAGVLTATLHASASGTFPAPAVVLLAVLLSGLASTALIGRAPSAPRLAATVAAGQVTFHTIFTAFGDTAPLAVAAGAHPGHAGHVVLAQTAATHGSPAHTGMLLAHVIAGLLSAVLLTRSERALRELSRLAAFTFGLLLRRPSVRPLPRPLRSGIHGTIRPLRSRTASGILRYRGPPALLRAA